MYSKSFLDEVNRFEAYGGCSADRTEIGLMQFHEFESRGVRPGSPDQYFMTLCDGKKWWEWSLNFMAEEFFSLDMNRWDGWMRKAYDFLGDASGFRQLRARCRCQPCDPEDVIESWLMPGEFYRGSGI